jgi:outer membrane usher protein
VQLSVTQQLGRTATLYLSGSHQTYWGTGKPISSSRPD